MTSGRSTDAAAQYTFDRFFIDGQWMFPSGAETFDVRSPHDQTPVGSAPVATQADVDRAVAAARRAFDDGPWPQMTVGQRVASLRPVIDAYGTRIRELAALVTAEMGSPTGFSEAAHGIGPLTLMQQTVQFAESYAWTERRGAAWSSASRSELSASSRPGMCRR